MGPYDVAQQWVGAGRMSQSEKLNRFLYQGGSGLSVQDRAWCADFMNATLKAGGQEGTGSGMARSFMQWGQPTSSPRPGDVAVFSRGDPSAGTGHVGYYQGRNANGSIRVLGGNQSGQVSEASYDAGRLLGFRTAGNGASGFNGLEGTPTAESPRGRGTGTTDYPLNPTVGQPNTGNAFDSRGMGMQRQQPRQQVNAFDNTPEATQTWQGQIGRQQQSQRRPLDSPFSGEFA